MSADEIPIDWRAYADSRRDERKHSSSCVSCGSPEPARIEATTCSDCTTYPKCVTCNRWLFGSMCDHCQIVVERTDGYVVVAEVAS